MHIHSNCSTMARTGRYKIVEVQICIKKFSYCIKEQGTGEWIKKKKCKKKNRKNHQTTKH